ncbi:MAG TPA: uroporphyrinogen-III synthase [Xanthobacteraceae bacterium]
MRLLVTRPEPDAERTAAALRDAGHQVEIAALLRIEPIPGVELGPGPWSAVVVTSNNALRALESHPRRAALLGLPLFAVGRRTAATARAAGFLDVTAAGGNVQELVRYLREQAGREPLLYLAGHDRSHDLAADLAADGRIVSTAVVYRAVKLKQYPPAVAAALAAGSIDGVLHFSRRSAQAYLDCARAAGLLDQSLAPAHYCVSPQVAEPLLAAGAKHVHVASRPEAGALVALIESGS